MISDLLLFHFRMAQTKVMLRVGWRKGLLAGCTHVRHSPFTGGVEEKKGRGWEAGGGGEVTWVIADPGTGTDDGSRQGPHKPGGLRRLAVSGPL